MQAAKAEIKDAKQRLSPIWVVPVAAVLLGLWLVVDNYLSQGPEVEISFAVATGIEANKTRVRLFSVDIGMVTDVRISDDLNGVVVTAKLDPVARSLLHDDSEFWVVRPNVRGFNVSGLGTLLSGAYIEFSPGIEKGTSKRTFAGLDTIPTTPVGTPGIRLGLTSQTSNALDAGSPILYRGFRVGTVESTDIDLDQKLITYSIFVDAPYDQLISTNTRFWDVSGVTAELSAAGVSVNVSSMQALIEGGISFGHPKNTQPGDPVSELMVFRLYPNEKSTHEDPYRHFAHYVVSFEQSLRGLRPGAPVTYRGLKIGSVERIMSLDLSNRALDLAAGDRGIRVLIKLEPGRLDLRDTAENVTKMNDVIEEAVHDGLRATLQSGSLLTGSLYVGLDFDENPGPERIGSFRNYPTLPTTSGGIGLMQVQINQLLATINDMPLEQTVASAEGALSELQATLGAIRTAVEDDDIQKIGPNLNAALDGLNQLIRNYSSGSEFDAEITEMIREIRFALGSIQDVSDRLGDNPNQLVFPSDSIEDPEPKAAEK